MTSWIVRAVNIAPFGLVHLATRLTPDGALLARIFLPYRERTIYVKGKPAGFLELLRRPVEHETRFDEIQQELWKTHSITKDNRDLPGPDLDADGGLRLRGPLAGGARWEGQEGAARFYTELLTAFPDIRFDLDVDRDRAAGRLRGGAR